MGEWADDYKRSWPDADLLIVELRGHHYLFDYAECAAHGDSAQQESRVVAAWGWSRDPDAVRDPSRMCGILGLDAARTIEDISSLTAEGPATTST